MTDATNHSAHTFHIPVMGTGFTVDTPLRVAKYGISTVISLVDDVLIEQLRKMHCHKAEEPYEEIGRRAEDARARRITAYLNLVDRLVRKQVRTLQASPFQERSDITQYYEMLPDSPPRRAYHQMLATKNPDEKARLQDELRRRAVPGAIDVNIMTKLDRDVYRNGERLAPEFADAMAALRGYANSSLTSSIIFSAGMNKRLFTYAARFTDFHPDRNGIIKKRIVLKVSDLRSAMIQGRFLAKRGLWVSEFRVESGLNCGGHAFATKGLLMGPILEEFKERKRELQETLLGIFREAAGGLSNDIPLEMQITAQGGIGTADEDRLLLKYFRVESTGWATPFLLVPEVANVDAAHQQELSSATDRDVHLSDSSPLGIPFWTLRTSASEEARRRRIREGKPGSPCPKGFLVSNTEFTKLPLCPASRAFQKRKLEHMTVEGLPHQQLVAAKERVVAKACICHDLGGGVTLMRDIDPNATPAICCGPGIADFTKISTLQEMVSHIYGRLSLTTRHDRPHMFIRELSLYVDHLRKEIEDYTLGLSAHVPKYFREFKDNLFSGIEYYRSRAEQFLGEKRDRFADDLRSLCEALEKLEVAKPLNA